jgi:hypothetical protein
MRKSFLVGLGVIALGLFSSDAKAATNQDAAPGSTGHAKVTQTEKSNRQTKKPVVGTSYYQSDDNPFHQN